MNPDHVPSKFPAVHEQSQPNTIQNTGGKAKQENETDTRSEVT